jgi:anti-sigma factor RsiW
MNQRTERNAEAAAMVGEADATLRLIAAMPAPDGLEERVKTGVRRRAKNQASALVEWPGGTRRSWMENNWLRGAAAAAIVAIVGGGSWQVYSRVQPKQAQIALPHVGTPAGGFANANAVRTPKTLDVPVVPQTLKQKNGFNDQRPRPKGSRVKTATGANAEDGAR